MPKSPVVGLVFDAWDDLNRVLDDLSADDACRQVDGGSSFAWTLGHIANQVDSYINVRVQQHSPHPLFASERWRMGGSGAADNWDEVRRAFADVKEAARAFLNGLDDAALAIESPYPGALPALQGRNISLRYSLQRIAAHTYFHIGEIAAVRSRRLNQQVGDYPGALLACL
jgi:hypothetical protein